MSADNVNLLGRNMNTVSYPLSEMLGSERVSDFGIPIVHILICIRMHNKQV
jgi:hypothetical protein